jgi:hypothetical protein
MSKCVRCEHLIEYECYDKKCVWTGELGKHKHFKCKFGKITKPCLNYKPKV